MAPKSHPETVFSGWRSRYSARMKSPFPPLKKSSILTGAVAAMLAVHSARAATFTYNNTATNSAPGTSWSAGTNWSAVPVSDPTTTLALTGTLAAGANVFTNNDIAGNFLLNVLTFTDAGPGSGAVPTVTISGGPLEFVTNGATAPTVTINSTGTVKPVLVINDNVVLTNTTTITATTAGTINGVISGAGGLTKLGAGILTLTGANIYSGANVVGGNGRLTISGTGSISPTTGAALTLGSGGSGTFQYDSSAASKFGSINIGNGTGTSSTLNQTNGTINGTTLTLNGGFSGSGFGTLNLSGGTMAISGVTTVSNQVSGDNIFSTINVSGAGNLTVGSNFFMTGAPAAARNAAGRVNQSGGAVTIAGTLNMARTTAANSAARRGEYNLTGGTLAVSQITQDAGADTFGTFNFNGGTLRPNASNASFLQGLTAANVQLGGAKIDTSGFNIGIAQTLLSGVANDGGLTKSGNGTLTLTAANTYVGATTISAGAVNLAHQSAVQNSTLTLNGGSVSFDSSVAGNAFTVGGLAASASGAGFDIALENNAAAAIALTVGGNNGSSTYAGALSGSGSLVKTGSGALTLSGANPFTGATTVSNGTLSVGGSFASAITVAPAGTLGGEGSTSGNVTFGAGSTFIFDPTTTGATDHFRSTGTIDTTAGATTKINITTGPDATSGSGLVVFEAATLTTNGLSDFKLLKRGTLSIAPTQLLFTWAPGGVVWKGGNGTNPAFWDVDVTPQNFTLGGVNNTFFNGDTVLFDDTASSFSVAIQGASVAPGTVTFNNSTNAYTLSGGAISGATSVTKTGTNSVTISSANSYTGTTDVVNGTLILNGTLDLTAINVLGTGTLNEGAGGVISGAASLSVGATAVLSGTNTYTGGTTIGGGTVTVNNPASLGANSSVLNFDDSGGTLALGATFSTTRAIVLNGNATIATNGFDLSNGGVIIGTGGVIKTGAGTLTLSGSSTYTGGTTINAGTVLAGATSNALGAITGALDVSGGALDLNGKTVTVGLLTGSGAGLITNGTAASIVFTASSGLSGTYAGIISNSAGTLGFTKSGTGTLTLTGANTYNGTTTISGGNSASSKLLISDAGSLTGGGALQIGSAASAGRFEYASSATNTQFSTITVGSGANGGTGSLVQSSGTITAAALRSGPGRTGGNSGNIDISGGTLHITGAATIGEQDLAAIPSTITISGSGLLQIDAGLKVGIAQVDTRDGNGIITQDGGTVTVVGGLTLAGTAAATWTRTARYNLNGGTLNVDAISMATTGAGTNISTFNFNGGTLSPIADSATFLQGLTSATVKVGGAIIDTVGFNVTIGQQLISDGFGDGGLTKSGPGTLTLSANNTYTGVTNVSAGVLKVNGTLGVGANVVNADAGRTDFGVSQTLEALNIADGAVVTLAAAVPAPAPEFLEMPAVLGAAAVPEPGSAALIFGGMLTLLGMRRGRAA